MKDGCRQWFQAQYRRYDRFMDKQGFYIVLTVCVLVIVLSALYTAKLRDTLENPVLTEDESSVASRRDDQTLAQAEQWIVSQDTPAPSPTAAITKLCAPVAGAVLRGHSPDTPVYYDSARAYAVHIGVDISAQYGALVTACESGEVLEVSESPDMGLCVVVRHGDGLEARYCGLSEAPYVRKGDTVRKGQTLGHVGNGVLMEQADGAHLHLALYRNGEPIDPERVIGDFSAGGVDKQNTL